VNTGARVVQGRENPVVEASGYVSVRARKVVGSVAPAARGFRDDHRGRRALHLPDSQLTELPTQTITPCGDPTEGTSGTAAPDRGGRSRVMVIPGRQEAPSAYTGVSRHWLWAAIQSYMAIVTAAAVSPVFDSLYRTISRVFN